MYAIIILENKTAAVYRSANSHTPAQVIAAPTQRTYVRTAGLLYPFETEISRGSPAAAVPFPCRTFGTV